MFKAFTILILPLYLIVLAVAVDQGPLISIQSLILGIMGLVGVTFLFVRLATFLNLIDIPDGKNKTHYGKVPTVGGICLFISLIFGSFVIGVDDFYKILLLSLIPILIVGIIDDIKGFSIMYRLIAQILSSLIVIYLSGIHLNDLGNLFGFGGIELGKFGILFTIFSVVGLCNAFNMIDGKDGLAGSVSLIILILMTLFLFQSGIIYNWGIIFILSLFVFLCFNLSLLGKKNKIFLGDHGSVSLGHLVAWSLIYLCETNSSFKPISAVWFVFLPLTDALLTFIRRIRTSSSIVDSDRKHFHHLLADNGFNDYKILMLFLLITIFGSFVGIIVNFSQSFEFLYTYLYLIIFSIAIFNGMVRK